jgi:hypothetical protein
MNICLLASFFVGGILMLERRCVGQMAFVQPMAIVLIAGMFIDQPVPALWFGVTLQLLSTGQTHYCNWVLAAVAAGTAMVALHAEGIAIVPGSVPSLGILVSSTLLGIASDQLDKWQARKDNTTQVVPAGAHPEETIEPFVRLIHRRIVRSFFISGLQSVVAVSVTCATGILAHRLFPVSHAMVQSIMLMAIPSFGVVAVLTSLVGMRFTFFAAVSAVVFTAVVVWA